MHTEILEKRYPAVLPTSKAFLRTALGVGLTYVGPEF